MNSYKTFQNTGGFFEISAGLIKLVGEKAVNLLHGQLTNNINDLKVGEGNYNLLLTLKGKVTADLFVYRTDHDFHLIIDSLSQSKVLDHLKKFAPLSRVEITEGSQDYSIFHICYPKEDLGLKILPSCKKYHLCTCQLGSIDSFCFRTDRLGIPGQDLIIDKNKKEDLISFLKNQKINLMNEELIDIVRVEQGVSKIGVDVTEANLPQESRLDHALNFDKGCYLGQEIIARLHYRGHVNKVLSGLKIDSTETLQKESPIFDNEKKVGQITSSIFSPQLNSVLCLGYVPYVSKTPGTKFLIGDKKISSEIINLPLS